MLTMRKRLAIVLFLLVILMQAACELDTTPVEPMPTPNYGTVVR